MFNNFLNTYLRCYNVSFVTKRVFNINRSPNGWITKGIKVSCKRKRELFVLARSSTNYDLKLYYKKYCATLTKVICKAKKLYYDNLILSDKNKMKTTWQIINKEIGTSQHNGSISSVTKNDTIVTDQLKIANIFNNYFISVVDTINSDKIKDSTTSRENSRDYRYSLHRNPCTKINWKYVSTHEIERIIRSLESKTSSGYDELSNQVIKLDGVKW